MKYILILFAFNLFSFQAASQNNLPGVYYLEGVMETASGFKLNADSTFEFFFSYGALDRAGKGKWVSRGNTITLKTDGEISDGFVMVKSEQRRGPLKTIKVNESNTTLLSFVYARFSSGSKNDFTDLGMDGILQSEVGKFDSIEIKFELCPERSFSFKPQKNTDNYFEFKIEPQIMDVYFNSIVMIIEDGNLKGPHPILNNNKIYTYIKEQ